MSRYRILAAAAALALAAGPAFAQADAAPHPMKHARPMVHHHAGNQRMGHGGASPSNADHMADQLNGQVLSSMQSGGSSMPAGGGAPMPPNGGPMPPAAAGQSGAPMR